MTMVSSCSNNTIVDEHLSIEDQNWNQNQKAVFEFNIDDTNEYYDIYLSFRNTDDYPYNNLYVFTTMRFPNNKIAVDTLMCRMADTNGKWYGSGFGGIYENKVRLFRNKSFPLEGKYTFEINQAMREEELKGISDVGFSIEIHEE